MKKFLFVSILMVLFMSCIFSTQAVEYTEVPVMVDGAESPLKAILAESVAYVNVEDYCKTIDNGNVVWDSSKLFLDVCSPNTWVTTSYPWDYVLSNGRYMYIDNLPLLINEKLYMPIRLMAKIYCQYVNWNEVDNTVELVSTGEILEKGETYYNSDDLYWLSRIISAESNGEPLLGKIAVGNVVINRVYSDDYPDTIHDVIFDRRCGIQFTPTANNAIYKVPTDESIIAAKICLEGYSISNKAMYFLNKKTAKNNWIINNRPFLKTIGNHSFYS